MSPSGVSVEESSIVVVVDGGSGLSLVFLLVDFSIELVVGVPFFFLGFVLIGELSIDVSTSEVLSEEESRTLGGIGLSLVEFSFSVINFLAAAAFCLAVRGLWSEAVSETEEFLLRVMVVVRIVFRQLKGLMMVINDNGRFRLWCADI